MMRTIHGNVRGRTSELDEDLGVAEGQEVEVQIKTIPQTQQLGDGVERTAGALADDPFWDEIMEEVHNARKIGRRPQSEGK